VRAIAPSSVFIGFFTPLTRTTTAFCSQHSGRVVNSHRTRRPHSFHRRSHPDSLSETPLNIRAARFFLSVEDGLIEQKGSWWLATGRGRGSQQKKRKKAGPLRSGLARFHASSGFQRGQSEHSTLPRTRKGRALPSKEPMNNLTPTSVSIYGGKQELNAKFQKYKSKYLQSPIRCTLFNFLSGKKL